MANLAITGIAAAQQVADSAADLTVAHPAFRTPGPRVIIDAAHNNFHTIDGRFEGGPATNAGPSASQPCP